MSCTLSGRSLSSGMVWLHNTWNTCLPSAPALGSVDASRVASDRRTAMTLDGEACGSESNAKRVRDGTWYAAAICTPSIKRVVLVQCLRCASCCERAPVSQAISTSTRLTCITTRPETALKNVCIKGQWCSNMCQGAPNEGRCGQARSPRRGDDQLDAELRDTQSSCPGSPALCVLWAPVAQEEAST